MIESQVVALLRAKVNEAGSLEKCAASFGTCQAQFIHAVLQGRARPGRSVLEPMGLERVVTYRRIK